MTWLALAALALAALPALLVAANLTLLRAPRGRAPEGALVSILIPARNEEGFIGEAVERALASRGVAVEVVVMDDGSTDRTAEIVRARAAEEPRLRLETAPALPEGWTGKVHACQRLADAARGTHLLFIDADVRLMPDAAARLAAHQLASGCGLVSGVPRQEMVGLGERLTVPLINYLLLAYLPLWLMRRRGTDPSLGAACGQLMLVEREAYDRAGGHAAIRHLLHDGIQLARRLRRCGIATDLVAGADIASCRMYTRFEDAWAGFIKNAHEGMAKPVALPVWTLLLGAAHVLPLPLILLGAGPAAVAALVLSLSSRAAVTIATREPAVTVLLHPAAVVVALAIQWTALLRSTSGRPAGWKGRLYPAG